LGNECGDRLHQHEICPEGSQNERRTPIDFGRVSTATCSRSGVGFQGAAVGRARPESRLH
jgi:hypothetical protein